MASILSGSDPIDTQTLNSDTCCLFATPPLISDSSPGARQTSRQACASRLQGSLSRRARNRAANCRNNTRASCPVVSLTDSNSACRSLGVATRSSNKYPPKHTHSHPLTRPPTMSPRPTISSAHSLPRSRNSAPCSAPSSASICKVGVFLDASIGFSHLHRPSELQGHAISRNDQMIASGLVSSNGTNAYDSVQQDEEAVRPQFLARIGFSPLFSLDHSSLLCSTRIRI